MYSVSETGEAEAFSFTESFVHRTTTLVIRGFIYTKELGLSHKFNSTCIHKALDGQLEFDIVHKERNNS